MNINKKITKDDIINLIKLNNNKCKLTDIPL